MNVNVKKLSATQLVVLTLEFNRRMTSVLKTEAYERERKKYLILLDELRQRRNQCIGDIPLVIRKDQNNQFGIINREYFNTLDGDKQKIYIDWKWPEL